MVFDVGSTKGDRECCEIEIENDGLVERTEVFFIHAQVHDGHDCSCHGVSNDNAACENGGGGESRDGGNNGERGENGADGEGGSGSTVEDSGTEGNGAETAGNGIVLFGGALNSSTCSLKVFIFDDDGKGNLYFMHYSLLGNSDLQCVL